MRLKLVFSIVNMIILSMVMACSKNSNIIEPTPEKYEGKTTLYQLPESTQNKLQMMSYIIQTKDDDIIVIDGGNEGDADYFLSSLKGITKEDMPTVDHWFLTHAHSDHTDVFTKLVEDNSVNINNVYCHFPTEDEVSKYEKSEAHTIVRINKAFDTIKDKTKVNVVKIGDRIDIGDTYVEVLYTYNANYKSSFLNNSSTIFRFNIEGSTVIFLADLGYEAGDWLYNEYGDELKSDIVQMAHHGSNGVRYKVYNKIDAQICLWPTPDWLWNNNQGKGYDTGPWETIVLHKYMEKIGVKTHYVTMNGLIEIEFPLES